MRYFEQHTPDLDPGTEKSLEQLELEEEMAKLKKKMGLETEESQDVRTEQKKADEETAMKKKLKRMEKKIKLPDAKKQGDSGFYKKMKKSGERTQKRLEKKLGDFEEKFRRYDIK